MKIKEIVKYLEQVAPPSLQESYDNAGLLTGSGDWECSGVLCTLDSTEAVVEEALSRNCNLIVAHHPILFKGIKRLNGNHYVERTLLKAIKNDIAIYAIHTNLDNVSHGVNGRIADKLGLIRRQVLAPLNGRLRKLYTFVPTAHTEKVREALFAAGAGEIGRYSECSFEVSGTGTFKAGLDTNPFVGKQGERHLESENKLEVIFPDWTQGAVLQALFQSHPYEEVAYDVVELSQPFASIGAGMLGELEKPMAGADFLAFVANVFGISVIRHTALTEDPIKKVAVCGGAGSNLIYNALNMGAQAYLTADIKYHEFFEADGRLVLCDIGHFESEQYTITLLSDILQQKFPTFAVLKSELNTNPVHYYF